MAHASLRQLLKTVCDFDKSKQITEFSRSMAPKSFTLGFGLAELILIVAPIAIIVAIVLPMLESETSCSYYSSGPEKEHCLKGIRHVDDNSEQKR